MKPKYSIGNENEQVNKAKEEAMDLVLRMLFTFILIGLVILTVAFTWGHKSGEKYIVQKLCSNYQYDFCKVSHIDYTLKELNK